MAAPLCIPERAWRIPPNRWLLRYRLVDGGWDTRTFRGTVEQARETAKATMAKSSRYESVWIVEHEDRKL